MTHQCDTCGHRGPGLFWADLRDPALTLCNPCAERQEKESTRVPQHGP